jgi:thioesterase domain-containing protein/acyl carrier protein
VPAYFTQLDAFPLGPNGKVDRAALPDPAGSSGVTGASRVAPATETERVLVQIWEDVLGHAGIGVTDNFFDAGGHSLTVARVVAQIEQRLGTVVPLRVLFELPTIRALATHLLDDTRFGIALGDDALVRLGGSGTDRPVFAFPSGTGDAAGYILLSKLLAPYVVYAFNFIERDTRLADYADLVRSVDPTGPYRFLGYSSGGNLAYHVTGEMERQGLAVASILMVDSARQYRRLPFDPDEVRRISAEFLAHESNRPYVTSVVLREKAERRITRSYQWIRDTVDEHVVAADIDLFSSDGADEAFHDAEGRLVASAAGWGASTRGRVETHRAEGPHAQMLHYPYVDRNAELIREVLDRGVTAGALGRPRRVEG